LDRVEEERRAGASEEELAYLDGKSASPQFSNYRFVRAFSPICPTGELGKVQVASMHLPLTKLQFEWARASSWPQVPSVVSVILKTGSEHPLFAEAFALIERAVHYVRV
jgi:hypothetical protein